MQPELPHPEVALFVADLKKNFTAAMDDDFNISGALAALFDFIKQTNPILQTGSMEREQKNLIMDALRRINGVFGFLRLEQCPLAPEIDQLIQDREKARQLKDWTAADVARDELLKKGVTIRDTATGPVWEKVD